MSVQVRELPAMRVVGLTVSTYPLGHPKNNPMLIPQLWDFLMQQIEAAGITFTGPMYGVMQMDGESMNYLAGFASDQEFENFEEWEIPSAKYAVFEHRGDLRWLGRTLQDIFTVQFPNSGLEQTSGYSLEVYDDRFQPGSEESVFELLFPVK